MSKKVKISLVIIFLSFWPAIFLYLENKIWPENRYFLVFCDVDQGDSILLISRDFQMMVDTGPDNSRSLSCLKKYSPPLDKKLEVLVLTHPDQDHIGASSEIISLYSPRVIIAPPVGKNTRTFQELLNTVSKQPHIEIENYPDSKVINLSDSVSIKFYTTYDRTQNLINPFKTEQEITDFEEENDQKAQNIDNYNSLSIGILLKIEQFSAWLSADLENKQELALVKRGVLEKVNVIKIGHHGAKTSSEQSFLDALQPENAVISVGKKNKYGHPASSVLERLKKMNLAVYRTDLLGDVVYVIENDSIWFFSGKNLTFFRFLSVRK